MIKKRKINYSLDDPQTTQIHKEIILTTPFLKKIYEKWYKEFEEVYKENPSEKYLEIGSGGGFLKEIIPDIITSDILPLNGVDRQIDAQSLPFEDESLGGIFMLNVFHHIPKPYLFLKETERTLRSGGKIVMIEPANTFFSRIVYKNFHHELFDENGDIEIKSGMPLSSSNQAFPYIYFIKRQKWIKEKFPRLQLQKIKYHTPLLYLLSGGFSYYPFVPDISFNFFKTIENIISPLNKFTALFYTIRIIKQ